jgi:chain length determinant protein EpsF
MTLRQFLLVLRARWKTALGLFLAAVIAAVIITMASPRLYTASASVVVDSKTDPVAGVAYAALNSTSYIATQVDIISSQRVAQRVVKILKLDKDGEWVEGWKNNTGGHGDIVAWIGTKLQKTLSVTPSRDSSVIDIAVTWTDPDTAAVLANAFAQGYVETDIELKVDPAKQYATWFEERSKALRADLEAKQKRLTDFQAQTGIVASNNQLDIENNRLVELNTQLTTIQAQRNLAISRSHMTQQDYDSLPEVFNNPTIVGLKSDLSRAEAKLKDIASNLGRNHPDYKNTESEIQGLQTKIAHESAGIAASLGANSNQALQQEAAVKAALDAQKKHMTELQHEHDQIAVFQNDVTTAQRNLDAVTQRLAQSSLESQSQQTNISILTPAVPPLFKSSPRLSLNVLVGGLLGVILGVGAALGLEISDRRVRVEVELLQLLGVPMLGRIPGMKSGPRAPRPAAARIPARTESTATRVEPSVI